jgi:transposase
MEFRRDVIAVARQGEQSIAQVAQSFGISESCLNRWLKIANREDGLDARARSAPGGGGSGELEAENRELRKRTKQLEQENEILRRATAYFARDTLPQWMCASADSITIWTCCVRVGGRSCSTRVYAPSSLACVPQLRWSV